VAASRLLDYAPALEAAVLAVAGADAAMVDCAETLLRCHLPPTDEHVPVVSGMVDAVATDRTIARVEQLVDRFGLTKRALERLFRAYVGVTPKWVIQRYRLFEAAERLASGQADGAQLAQELGYFDQAHFSRDFKAMVGTSPVAFARDVAGRGI
jgi:AraC-like DNA-binding protein